MELEEILNELATYTGEFPKTAVEEAIEAKEEITPKLLEVLENTIEQARNNTLDPDAMGHIYALYLLSQFKESKAYPLLIEILSLPGDLPDDLLDDSITEAASRMLASVCDGNTEPMRSLVENAEAYEYSRGAALEAILIYELQQGNREGTIDYYKHLFDTLPREYSYIWGDLISCCNKLYPEELYEDIKRAFEEDLVDPAFISLDDIDSNLRHSKEEVLSSLSNRKLLQPIEDVVAEMEWWAAFQTMLQESMPTELPALSDPRYPSFSGSSFSKQAPIRKEKKIGRNEPCPCGSGKKYKKCCDKKG